MWFFCSTNIWQPEMSQNCTFRGLSLLGPKLIPVITSHSWCSKTFFKLKSTRFFVLLTFDNQKISQKWTFRGQSFPKLIPVRDEATACANPQLVLLSALSNPAAASESSGRDWGPGGGPFSSNGPWRRLIEFPLPLCVSLSAVWTAGVYPAPLFILLRYSFHTQCAFCSPLHTFTHTHTHNAQRTEELTYSRFYSYGRHFSLNETEQCSTLPCSVSCILK